MKLVDTAGAIAAHRHGRRRVVTAEMDSMRFVCPVHVGDLVTIRARVTAVWDTSLETRVEVESENVLTGERRHASSAYLVYVALDDQGRPTPLPPLVLETDAEREQAVAAKERRRLRLAARAEPPRLG
jgi:acyl-CoA hydrolase